MEQSFRCDCPITSALDILGDKWMLVIIKQMLIEHKLTFKDFSESDEAIATNILSSKLKILEELELVNKSKIPNNKKTNLYHLTEKGMLLAPTLIELALWSDANLRELNPEMRDPEELQMMKDDKAHFIQTIVKGYKEKISMTLA